jgi:hypothetical protein
VNAEFFWQRSAGLGDGLFFSFCYNLGTIERMHPICVSAPIREARVSGARFQLAARGVARQRSVRPA